MFPTLCKASSVRGDWRSFKDHVVWHTQAAGRTSRKASLAFMSGCLDTSRCEAVYTVSSHQGSVKIHSAMKQMTLQAAASHRRPRRMQHLQ